ncbi:uncharacterized protein DUF2723 [Sphingobacterium allocomposti]|uniref:Uncharacterized protein DUF2723 n=1 Tax=Sphingobacterium allocomposti TaxID=415956 RepID=A0A5S5D4E2_9SPHI|nr:DUF2723 domain-containing protein [Sphingobacterium composti Yoo et al. 2007 non Ten et al. 2007]TYP90148.1 uncharacterized protein DUF2723 [Sphingobacterium composti Yoo et al. 2007 non Ten et al. 2007]
MNYEKTNNLIGWLLAISVTVVYMLTADRFSSWWDTGEFIAAAYKLQIVHQPGAPLFLMIQNVFSNLAMGDASRIAFCMNIGSAVCSGLTVLFLFWTITALASKVIRQQTKEAKGWEAALIMLAGVTGAGAYAFSDTFWYSAVESEVYAMSSLCTAAVFWLILKWEKRADEPQADRWLLLIMYIMGLSIGVHLLNLLTIPALALIIYFRRTGKTSLRGISAALLSGIAALAFVLWGIIQYSVRLAAQFDLFFVNHLGLGFGSGVMCFALLLIAALIWGIRYSIHRQKPLLNTALLGVCFVLFGYTSFAMIVIRAHADPPLNNNAPDNVYSFLGYLSREQYSSEPLVKGPSFDAKVLDVAYQTTYKKGEKQYEKMTRQSSYVFDKEMFFPRVYSEKHAEFYRMYLGLRPGETPSFLDNLRFFFSYQLGDMYGRYFLWNFVGRQNDEPKYAGNTSGNWVSGVTATDDARLGGQRDLPVHQYTNPSRNVYYYIPLLVGIAGLIWHFRRDRKHAAIVALLFFFTGIAIVLYLNQSPVQPRERDYAYAGSFYAFSIWIGFGVFAVADLLRRKLSAPVRTVMAGVLCLSGVPLLLLNENFDDHDRSARDLVRHVAHNYLQSCEPNAILFTYADNDTFPLWYLQEVEGVRTDVRIVNLSYLLSHWYVKQLANKVNDAAPVDTSIAFDKVAQGVRDYLPFVDQGISEAVDLDMLLQFMLSDNPTNQLSMQDGSLINYLPAKRIKMAVDKESVLSSGVVPEKWASSIVEEMEWEYSQNYMTRAELALLGIIKSNNWKRPIYFTNYTPAERMAGLSRYLIDEGLVKKLLPVAFDDVDGTGAVNVDRLYELAVHDFEWGNYASQNYVDIDSRNYMDNFVIPDIYERTVQLLNQHGDTERAGHVAVKAASLLPKRIYGAQEAYHYSGVVDTLYKGKRTHIANEIVERHIHFLEGNFRYADALARDKPEALDARSIQYSMAALERYRTILGTAKDERYAAIDDLYNRYRARFFSE